MGLKLAAELFSLSLFFFFWVFFPLERGSVLLVCVGTTMRTRPGFVAAETHFLTHVNEWRLTFHSSGPFAQWQL